MAGKALRVTDADGALQQTLFPAQISPGQPVQDIRGLTHSVGGVKVDLGFAGDIFEMEDQRNWTDASFKTYCRPLSLPRPYRIKAGEEVN